MNIRQVSTVFQNEIIDSARLISAPDRPIGELGTCFGNQSISLESIVQLESRDGRAVIVVVTHNEMSSVSMIKYRD